MTKRKADTRLGVKRLFAKYVKRFSGLEYSEVWFGGNDFDAFKAGFSAGKRYLSSKRRK